MLHRPGLFSLAVLLAVASPLWLHAQRPGAGGTGTPQKGRPARTDLYGDPLPVGAVARMGTVRFRQQPAFKRLGLSRDGKTLASVGWSIDLWDYPIGLPRKIFKLPPGCQRVFALGFSPEGRLLALGNRDSVSYFHRTSEGHVFRSWSGGVKEDPTLYLWDTASGAVLLKFHPGKEAKIPSAALSPDGKLVALGGVTLQLHQTATGKELRRLGGADADVYALAFSPDGKLLASAPWGKRDAPVRLWDVATGKEVRRCVGHKGRWIADLAFSPDGRTLAGVMPTEGSFLVGEGGHTEAALWEVATGKLRRKFRTPLIGGCSGAFTPDGKTLVMGGGGFPASVFRLDVATGREVGPIPAHRRLVSSLSFSPDGKLLASGSRDGTVRLWEAATGKPLRCLRHEQDSIEGVAFTPDGRAVASGGVAEVRLQDARTGKELRRYESPGVIWSLAFSPDGKALAGGGYDGTHVLWDTATGKELRRFSGAGAPWHVGFSPDGKLLAAGGAPWEVSTGERLARFRGLDGGFVGFSPDGRTLFTSGREKSLHLWEVATGRERGRLAVPRHYSTFVKAAVSPDGRLVAADDPWGRIHLYEVRTGREVGQFPGHPDGVWCLAFSPDGRRLTSASWDTTLLIWEVSGASP